MPPEWYGTIPMQLRILNDWTPVHHDSQKPLLEVPPRLALVPSGISKIFQPLLWWGVVV